MLISWGARVWVSDIDSRINIANYHNDVRTDIIRPRSLHNFIDKYLVGCGDSTHRCRDSGTGSLQKLILRIIGGTSFACFKNL